MYPIRQETPVDWYAWRLVFSSPFQSREARELIPGASERDENGEYQLEVREDDRAVFFSGVKPNASSDVFLRKIVRLLKRKERKWIDEEP